MSFVNPLSALGEPEREGLPTLRELAARSVAEQLQTRTGADRYRAAGASVDSPFQLARADAIAQEAAGFRKNRANGDYVQAYGTVMFSQPRRIGPKNDNGLTAQMRSRKRLMQTDLSAPYYAKLRRLAARDHRLPDPLAQALTPEERATPRLPNPLPAAFVGYLCQYYNLPGSGVLSPVRAAGIIMEEKDVEWATAEKLVRIAWGLYLQR